jgi:hypothetical protein
VAEPNHAFQVSSPPEGEVNEAPRRVFLLIPPRTYSSTRCERQHRTTSEDFRSWAELLERPVTAEASGSISLQAENRASAALGRGRKEYDVCTSSGWLRGKFGELAGGGTVDCFAAVAMTVEGCLVTENDGYMFPKIGISARFKISRSGPLLRHEYAFYQAAA